MSDQANKVTIGDIEGGIHGSTIAGRDVNELVIDQLITNVFEDDTALKTQRDRQDVIALMRRLWIDRVLAAALGNQPLRQPRLELRPDLVEQPWAMVVDLSDRQRQQLPPGAALPAVFETATGSLLLLGQGGSGKTTLLLDLARQALDRAVHEPGQPLPVVVPLGWRSDNRQPLAVWLVEVLAEKYFMRADTVQRWLDQGDLLLLLDGLDQLQPDRQRAACVRAINDFIQEYGLTQLIVTCRPAAYEALDVRLQLQQAVSVQPAAD